MKKILYTQRVEIIESYNERRDCADQNIPRFIYACGYLPLPIPNIPDILEDMIIGLEPDGIILTGGNSFVKLNGNAPERDQTDRKLIEIAIREDIPLYGFCRGMQSILDYFDVKLENVNGHVGIKHNIHGDLGECKVNSYHNQASFSVNNAFDVLAKSVDGVIEAVKHKDKRIIATMWHPERELPFDKKDIERIQQLFK